MGNNIKSHKIELRPTARQDIYLRKCAGVMRYTYNSLVSKWKSGEKYDRKVFQKYCIDLRKSTSWMKAVASRATYEAADNFNNAINNFFASKKGKRKGRLVLGPSFKKKGKDTATVRFSHNTQFSVRDNVLKIPNLKSKIRMRERVRFNGLIKSVTITQQSGKWYASFVVDIENTPVGATHIQKPSVGVDLGIKNLAVLSTGEVCENPRHLQRKLRLLKRRQRQSSRKFIKGQKQSNRYKISAHRISRIHKKIKDQRSAVQHRFTNNLISRFDKIIIENLAVSNMLKNRRLSRAISTAGWYTIRTQLEYKSTTSGVELIVADRFFPSSKICSSCGHKLAKLSLQTRVFNCPACKNSIDRDLNAAINLAAYGTQTRPIMASLKTSALDLRKSESQDEAGLPDGANINLQPRVSAECAMRADAVI